ncbi:MAG TPA: AAA family ATPase [Jiangellaceae bacterium]|nr:AAA family ATPase [Jiangellaceae bacterium]
MLLSPSSPGIVGRAGELGQLRSALAAARTGQPVTVLLGGEAGIGKTRLVGEFTAEAADAGALVIVGQSVEIGGDGLPFGPVVGAMRDLVDHLGAEFALENAGPGRGALAGLLPELGVATGPSDDARGRLLEVVTVLLERAAAERTVVLVLEDLHWADGSTRDLLRFVVRALGSARVLVIGTFRTDEIHRAHPLRPFLAELDRVRSVRRIDLPRLTRSEVGEQLQGILGRRPGADLVARVYRRSDGVPFFVEELAGVELEQRGGALPDSLRDLLLVRVERVSDRTQDVLRLLATGGLRVDHAVLSAVAELDSVALDDALREAVSANIVRVDGEGYAFRHALLREVLHDDLLPGAHARLHTRYAEVLEVHPEAVSTGSAAAEIAHHWYAAHDMTRAFDASLRAADEAQRSYAHAEVQRMLERALALWNQMPDPVATTGGDRADLLTRAASAATDAGELERALALVDAALDEVDATAEPLRRADLLEQRAKLLSENGRPEATAVVQSALDLVPAEPPSAARARLLQMLSSRFLMEGRIDQAGQVAVEAIAAARAVGEIEAEFRGHNILAPSMVQLGRVDEGLATFDAARELAGDVPRRLVGYYINSSDSLHLLGRHAEAAQVAREGLDRAREIGLARSLGAMLAGNTAEPLLALGKWDEAERLISRALELDPPVRHVWHLLTLRAWLSTWRGDLDDAALSLDEARSRMTRRTPGPQYELPLARVGGELSLARGDAEAAWTEISAALKEPRQGVPGYDLPLMSVAARALAARSGSGSDVDAGIRRVREVVDGIGEWGPAPIWRSVVEAEVAGGTGADPAPWREVVALVESMAGPRHLGAYGNYRLGAALAGRGDREAASEPLRAAAAMADDLGARLVRHWVDDLARRAHIRLLDDVSSLPDRSHGLTSREREVLRLVAAGSSNRQIGEALFISTKTASVHVSNILAKLGVTGRGEAAAIAHREGLVDHVA